MTGELLYNGQAQSAQKRDAAFGLQSEGVYHLNDAHTLRGGVIIQGERGTSKTNSLVFPVDDDGVQLFQRAGLDRGPGRKEPVHLQRLPAGRVEGSFRS